MAESLLFSIAQGVLGKIASSALEKAFKIYDIENQISELKSTLIAITAVLLDAEKQQSNNCFLQVWLGRLRDILYDAEDVLDELECEALRNQVISQHGGVKEQVQRFFSISNPLMFRAKISYEIKQLRETLSKISEEKNRFGLNVDIGNDDGAHMQSRQMAYSSIDELDVVGRDIDKQNIIEMLLKPNENNLSVIPIVGIGGLGKTTLAKLVYDDNSVKEHFELRLWVCTPDDFDFNKTIEKIIKEATRGSLSNGDIQESKTSLQNILKNKRYLLVLDDVWSDNHDTWIKLEKLLSKGGSESKIIVTTRSLDVASMMGTYQSYNLKGLSLDASMALFKKCAFSKRQPRSDLLEIGNDIIEKSEGVPLLVKTLGSLLCTKDEKWYWEHIRDSETWKLVEKEKNILLALKLSYDHLPFHLKPCFATFSLFPKGYKISSDNIARLWMALGLISSIGEKIALEDLGVEYVKDLWKRSLLHIVEESELRSCFMVHDLIHSLATIVAQNNYSIVGFETTKISEGVRYVSFSSTSSEGDSTFNRVLPFMRKPTLKKLRAIRRSRFQFGVDDEVITKEFVRTCISKYNRLRYLDLSCGCFEELPSSISNLKQLRSLRLRENKRLKKLPNTICKLQNLLQLSLHGCLELLDLPKHMKRLVSLRFLSVTTKQKSLQESGIQDLENLHFLGIYMCANLQVLFEGTSRLNSLRELEIGNCRRPIFLPFGELKALESLAIDDCELTLTQGNKSNFPLNLRKLVISRSQQVMDLLQCLDKSACTLESFSIYDCLSLTAIPEWLTNHLHLRSIRLIRCHNLSSIPQRFKSLIDLKELRIELCGELSRRCEYEFGEDWYKISHVPRIQLNLRYVQWIDD